MCAEWLAERRPATPSTTTTALSVTPTAIKRLIRAWHRRRTGEIGSFAALGWQRKRLLAQLRLERVLVSVLAALLALAFAGVLHSSGVAVGGIVAVPIILVLCAAYVAAGELPTRRLVQSRWPT